MTYVVNIPEYMNPSLSVKDRVSDILRRMTLEEKAAQMVCVWNNKQDTLLDEDGGFDEAKAKLNYGNGHGLGQVGRPGDAKGGASPKQFAELTNAIQRFFIENTRLGIPVLFHDECLHGLVSRDATSFGQPIGLAATFDPNLVERLYHLAAHEARACGIHQVLAPVLDVAREPRWGRVEETFGEDPYLVGEMGVAAVRGFQGHDRRIADDDRVICTLKHFAAHSQPESGSNCAPVSVSERHLREIFLAPFERAIRVGGAMSVMASYNEIDGVPSHASKWLLRDVLRNEWKFDGSVVSDYYAIRELWIAPNFMGMELPAIDKKLQQRQFRAGVNIELPEPDCYESIVDLVNNSVIKESELDELVSVLLTHKFELGLFDSPYVDPLKAERIVGNEDKKSIALDAARKTITLLKNDDNILPLSSQKNKVIAVIGPNADRVLLGGYSGQPKHFTTVLDGIRSAFEEQGEVLYAKGCDITLGGSWEEDEVVRSDPSLDRQSINEAVEIAKQADVIVLAVGGNEQTSREAWMSNHMGDRTDLQMVGLQDELVDKLHETGKPIISLLFNGRPLAVTNLLEKSTALLECWYLGQESGTAVADVLFGKVNPSGKLPITIPRSVGHLPAYYNYRPSARRGYLFDDITPLFPFGFGLSYSSFEFSKPSLSPNVIHTHESTCVNVSVTNTGAYKGDEVVQVYIRDVTSSVTRPVLELKGFSRITLEPGETKEVSIEIGPDQLAFWNINKDFVVEPGDFDILVGPNSATLQSTLLIVHQ